MKLFIALRDIRSKGAGSCSPTHTVCGGEILPGVTLWSCNTSVSAAPDAPSMAA